MIRISVLTLFKVNEVVGGQNFVQITIYDNSSINIISVPKFVYSQILKYIGYSLLIRDTKCRLILNSRHQLLSLSTKISQKGDTIQGTIDFLLFIIMWHYCPEKAEQEHSADYHRHQNL